MAKTPVPPEGPLSLSDADTTGPERGELVLLPTGPIGSRYEILEELGRGAMAVVYRARDRTVDVEVALKVLSIAVNDRSGRIARVRRELKAAWKVTHPGVVRLYDLIELDDRVAISMEWVEGETLAARLKRAPRLPAAALQRLALELADALAAAHQAGVIHRDLKPANIILRARGDRPVITDFGVSRVASAAEEPIPGEGETAPPSPHDLDPRLTQSGSLLGTPMYMAPEQLAADDNVGPAADVYALGLVLYEAAAGELPYQRSMTELLAQRRGARPPSLAKLRPDLPPKLARAIDDCLEPSPAARIPDGLALKQRLSGRTPRRWRGRTLALAGLVPLVLLALALSARQWLRDRLPAHDRRLGFVVDNLGGREDDWLVPVLERAARRRVNGDELRLRAVTAAQHPNVLVRLQLRRDGELLRVSGDLRPAESERAQKLPELQGASVAALLDGLMAQLSGTLGAGQAERRPDGDEADEMRRRGVASYRAWMSYQRAALAAFGAVNTDVDRVEAAARAAAAAEPGWADPHVMLAIVRRDSQEARAALARSLATQPPGGRGAQLIAATQLFVDGRGEEAIGSFARLHEADPGDETVGWMLAALLFRHHRVEEAIAVERPVHLRHPDLQFGVDLENHLRALGRTAEVAAVQSRWLREAPDAEQPLSAQVALDVEQQQLDRAVTDAQHLLLVHGSESRRDLLCDVLIADGRLAEAATVANEMVTATGQQRADGWLRVGQIATLQGRFAAAFDAYGRAAREGHAYGDQGPTFSALVESADLGLRIKADAEVERALAETVRFFEASMRPEQVKFTRFEHDLTRVPAGGRCPDLAALTRAADLSPPARVWRRRAASYGCVPCRAVVAEGRGLSEPTLSSLYEFGLCAQAERAEQLAGDAFSEVRRVRTLSTDSVPSPETASSVMASFQLGRVLEARHQKEAARAAYGDFLAHWGHPDRPIPEVDAAYQALDRLH